MPFPFNEEAIHPDTFKVLQRAGVEKSLLKDKQVTLSHVLIAFIWIGQFEATNKAPAKLFRMYQLTYARVSDNDPVARPTSQDIDVYSQLVVEVVRRATQLSKGRQAIPADALIALVDVIEQFRDTSESRAAIKLLSRSSLVRDPETMRLDIIAAMESDN